MKKTLFAGMLLLSQFCGAQRFLEFTNNSWLQPNLSTETYQDIVFHGWTEIGPNGVLSPTFKLTDLAGTPAGPSFYAMLPDAAYLMDFTINQQTQRIVMACATAVPNTATRMIIVETTFSGAVTQVYREQNGAKSMFPHQIIHSPTSGQIVVVGTSMTGILTSANTLTIPKTGFVMALAQNNFGVVAFTQEFNTTGVAPNDHDMLESVAEVPNWGYFVTGSANNPTVSEQNLLNVGVTYAGAVAHSRILDNTTSLQAGASVLYANTRIYVLSNNSALHTFQIGMFNPMNGAMVGSFFRYPITTLPIGNGVDVNGFRLQQTQGGQIMVAGYIHCTTTALPQRLTPFHMLLNPTLSFVYGQQFLSGNNVTMAPYFDEGGASVYINTPDIFAYNNTSMRSYVMNPNSVAGGYDMNRTNPVIAGSCERKLTVTVPTAVPADLGPASFHPLQITPAGYSCTPANRLINYTVLCEQAAIAAPSVTSATIFPNPATAELNVEIDSEILEITVSDMKGNKVMTAAPSNREKTAAKLDISNLKAGVYLIDITAADGIVRREKFIKE